jgi:hypothetical protein
VRTFGFVLVLALVPLPFLFGSRTTVPSNDPAAPATAGLVLCDGQADALRFVVKPGGRIERDQVVEDPQTTLSAIAPFATNRDGRR